MALLGDLISNEVNFRTHTEEIRGQIYAMKKLRLSVL
jgi:hypothetical protein